MTNLLTLTEINNMDLCILYNFELNALNLFYLMLDTVELALSTMSMSQILPL